MPFWTLLRRQPARQERWEKHLARQIEGYATASATQADHLRTVLWAAGVTLRAGDARWTLPSASVVVEAVERIAQRFGGDAHPFLAGLTVVLQTHTAPWWAPLWRFWNRQPLTLRFAAYENLYKIYFRPETLDLSRLVHEIGHYVDERHRLCRDYRRQLYQAGVPDFDANRFEDFASAFADYVLGRPLDPARYAYFERLRIQHNPP